jgi:hypothetical protein
MRFDNVGTCPDLSFACFQYAPYLRDSVPCSVRLRKIRPAYQFAVLAAALSLDSADCHMWKNEGSKWPMALTAP